MCGAISKALQWSWPTIAYKYNRSDPGWKRGRYTSYENCVDENYVYDGKEPRRKILLASCRRYQILLKQKPSLSIGHSPPIPVIEWKFICSTNCRSNSFCEFVDNLISVSKG